MNRVIPRGSTFRMRWDLGILLLILISCLLVPYQVAFAQRVDAIGSLVIYAIDLVFLLDVLLNFRTSYRRRGVEVTDRSRIARRYRRSLFALTRDDFDRIRTDYPEFRNVLKTISSEKSDRLSALVLDGVVL
jgi:hypothetical protein